MQPPKEIKPNVLSDQDVANARVIFENDNLTREQAEQITVSYWYMLGLSLALIPDKYPFRPESLFHFFAGLAIVQGLDDVFAHAHSEVGQVDMKVVLTTLHFGWSRVRGVDQSFVDYAAGRVNAHFTSRGLFEVRPVN